MPRFKRSDMDGNQNGCSKIWTGDYRLIGGYRGLVENNYIQFDLRRVSGIKHIGGTILGMTNRHIPFNFMAIVNGIKQASDQSDRAASNIRDLSWTV